MARVKRGVASKKRHKKVLKQAKGYYGNKSRSFRAANEQVMRSGNYAYRDRRARKGEMRRAAEAIGREKYLGSVLNDSRSCGDSGRYYYYDYGYECR